MNPTLLRTPLAAPPVKFITETRKVNIVTRFTTVSLTGRLPSRWKGGVAETNCRQIGTGTGRGSVREHYSDFKFKTTRRRTISVAVLRIHFDSPC